MNKLGKAAVAAGIGAAATTVLRRRGQPDEKNRWLGVTVDRAPGDVLQDGKPPEPLARLGDAIEIRVRPAPGDRGTELYARPTQAAPGGAAGAVARVLGDDPRQAVRTALREAKSLLETGEVLQPTRPGSSHPGPMGKLVQLASSRAQGEGRL